MKKLLLLSVFVFPLFLMSCGPNAEQKAAMQKHHDDSIAQVAAQNAQRQQQQTDLAKQQHEEDVAKAQHQHDVDVSNLAAYQQQLESRIADLQVARNQLNDIQGFHFGRTQAERMLK